MVVAEIAKPHAGQARVDARPRPAVSEPFEPIGKGAAAVSGELLSEFIGRGGFCHVLIVA
jgi:hypothetical protein